MAKRVKSPRGGKLAAALQQAAHDTRARALVASALAAGGAIATAKLVRDRLLERRRRRRSPRYRLQPGESPRAGIGRVARGQLDLAIGLLEDGHNGAGDDAIHEARKALKRLRAALRVSRGFLGTERYRHENTIVRDAGRALSDARDAQVLVTTLDELAEPHADEPDVSGWPRLREALEASAERDGAAPAPVVEALSDARARVSGWPLPQKGGPQALAPGLERVYRRGRRAFHVAEHEPSTEHLHELRKRAKDLWYAAQLLKPTAPKRMKKVARRAHRLSDVLGKDHDLAVLLERAEGEPELLAPTELEALREVIARQREQLQREAMARASRLYKRKPRKLARLVAAS